MESRVLPVEVKVDPEPRNWRQLRLRVLLAFSAVIVALLVISRLEPEQAKRCGPFIESVYLVFNPPIEIELTDAGKQFIAEMTALGGCSRIAVFWGSWARMRPSS